MSDPHPLETEPRRKRGGFGVWGWIFLVVLAAIAAALVVFWRTTASGWLEAYRKAQAVAARCEQVFNFTPEIRIDSRVVVAANTSKFEVVTVQKQALMRHAWSHSWLHSTKTFDIEANFTAQAGYDLGSFFHMKIDPHTLAITADLPQPKILTIGMSDVRILTDEDGLWNRLTPEDRQEAFRDLEKEARKNFEESDLLEAASREMQKRLNQVFQAASPALPSAPKN